MISRTEIAASRLICHRFQARPEWIDTNRHVNASHYLALVKEPALAAHEVWDYADPFRDRTGESNFVLESQVVYLREILQGDDILVTTRIVGLDRKRMDLLFEIINETRGCHAALIRYLVAHVSLGPPPRTKPMPEDLYLRLKREFDQHSRLPLPSGAERLNRMG